MEGLIWEMVEGGLTVRGWRVEKDGREGGRVGADTRGKLAWGADNDTFVSLCWSHGDNTSEDDAACSSIVTLNLIYSCFTTFMLPRCMRI